MRDRRPTMPLPYRCLLPSAMLTSRLTTLCVITIASLLSGCAIERAPAPQPIVLTAPPRAASSADNMMAELRRLQALPPAQLNAARESARETFERDPAEFRRLSYTLALLASPPTPSDDERLLQVIEPWLQASNATTADSETARVLAGVVQQSVLSRKRLRDEVAARARPQQVAKREDREPEIRALKQRIDELEKQLVAMKSIERSVTRR